jgi:hypothetical protein
MLEGKVVFGPPLMLGIMAVDVMVGIVMVGIMADMGV